MEPDAPGAVTKRWANPLRSLGGQVALVMGLCLLAVTAVFSGYLAEKQSQTTLSFIK
ncbi:MAG: hypothetical protein HQ512_08515 [Rhodospirillales bacterium]|nr:hypothetical protein [Rhodospirillales bacterium]